MPDITCPVCRSVNASTRTFCWKCAADLHAVVADPTAPPPPPKVEVPIRPLLIGGGVALAAIALIAIVVVMLGGTPAASISPSGLPSGIATTAPASDGAGGATSTPGAPATVAPATQPPPTEPPAPTAAPPATPKVTPVPKPKIVEFKGPSTVNCADPGYTGFITLTWLIDNADSTTLSIDGGGLYKSYPGALGSDQVPFACGEGQHTYTLSTVGGTGPAATKTLTITEG